MASTIVITFSRDALENENVLFEMYDLDGTAPVWLVTETWKLPDPRTQLKTVPVVVTVPPQTLPAGSTVQKYAQSLQLDYGENVAFSILANGNTITLTTVESATRRGFRNFACNTDADIFATAVITNDAPNPLTIVSESLGVASNFCRDVQVDFLTSEIVTEIILNGVTITNAADNGSFPVLRGINNTIYYKDANGNQVPSTLNVINKGILDEGNISINVETNISGATVTVNVTFATGLILEYSTDASNWQLSNVFSGLVDGDYTMYVKDDFGCVTSKDFSVTSDGTKEPFLFVSKANSLNFILQQETSSCVVPKNDENTFAHQNIAMLPACTETLLQTCDKITTQLKSNYDTVTALVRDDSGTETPITVEKMSANINRFESMDCTMYAYGESKAGIYFTSGDMYDFGFIPNGDTYTLNGNLPDFAVLGNVVSIDGLGTFEITSVLFDDRQSVRKKVIVIDYNYNDVDVEIKIASYYNLLPYEVYQFEIDWSLFAIGIYEVEFKNEDSQNGTVIYLSENINLAVEHFGTVRIDYYNSNNRDIFYKYGIENRIRIPFISIQAIPNNEQEISLTDNGAYVVDSIIYEADKITFDDMVKSLMRKVSIALGCQYVFVNGVGYVGESGIEFEAIGQTNLYTVSKTMVKSNVSYNTRHTGNSGVSKDYINFNIPALISYGEGLIKR